MTGKPTPDPPGAFAPAWLGGPSGRYFRRIRPDVEALPWASLDPSAFEPALVARARRAWTEASANEQATAIALTQLVDALLAVNAPVDLVAMASDFIADEMLHVELTARVADRLGGAAPRPFDPAQARIALAPDLSPLQRANELAVRVCCVGEAFSLPMLAGTRRASTHPLVRQVLQQIVTDEAHHGLCGFWYLEWVDARLDDAERARLGHCVADALSHFAPLWQRLTSRVEGGRTSEGFPIEQVHALGWMLSEDYRATALRAVQDEVLTPLAEFGIRPPADTVAQLLGA